MTHQTLECLQQKQETVQILARYSQYNILPTDKFKHQMKKFGGLGVGKSPLRHRPQQQPQPKTSMTSLASLAQMVGQAHDDDYSNIKLCLNSEKPQLELEQHQQPLRNWKDKSPLRGPLNKENDFMQFGNRNGFETNNRFAECMIKERPREEIFQKNPPHNLGNLLSKNRNDVSPGRQRAKQLIQGDLVFRAGVSSTSRAMNFGEISRKFNEQQSDDGDLTSYAPTLEDSRPKSRTKAPKIQRQFDEDDFVDIRESIRDQEFFHKQQMSAGQRQRFQSKIEEIKQQKMKILKDKRNNRTLLPKIIEEIKTNATREIEEFAMYLFNQSKKEDDEYLLEPEPEREKRDVEDARTLREYAQVRPKKSFEEKVEQKKVIIGNSKPHIIKPIESHVNKVNDSTENWTQNRLPFAQSQYPVETQQVKPKLGSPSGLKLEPQPTRLVRGLDLVNANEVVATSVKQFGQQFSKRQDQLVMQLQRKRSEDERVVKQREEQEKERQRQDGLLSQMQAKRKKFEEEARLRQQEASRLEQERVLREQEKQRIQNEERIRDQLQAERLETQRKHQEEVQAQKQLEQDLRRQQEERERIQNRRLEEERVQRQRIQAEEREIQAQRRQMDRVLAEEREKLQRQRLEQAQRQEAQRISQETQRAQRRRVEEEESERIRQEVERSRIQAQNSHRQRLQLQRVERERQDRQRQLERLREEERRGLEQQRLRIEGQQKKLELLRIEREQQQIREKERRDAQQRKSREEEEVEERKRKVFAEYQEEMKREQALREAEGLQSQREREERERQTAALAPSVNTSFKFDLGGDDMRTSFKFDNLFTGFSISGPEASLCPELKVTPPPPTSLEELTKNQKINKSIDLAPTSALEGMDFQFDLGLNIDVPDNQKFA